ncbi:MAG: hypothetical protein ACPGQR_02250 [Marinirhabdus sp.]
MDYKKQLGKNIAVLMLFAALMLPSAIQFFHVFNGHGHIACTERTAHVHKHSATCEIYGFYLTPFDHDIAEYPDLLPPKTPVTLNEDVSPLQLPSFKITNTQLRAPPIFC